MLKLLLLLAGVAALAVAAPSAAADFNDPSASPLDASDFDASDFDASDFDASDFDASDNDASDLDDIDADDLEILHDDSRTYDERSLNANADPVRKAQTCEEILGSGVTCPTGQYIIIRPDGKPACSFCSENRTLPYGDFELCGRGLCVDCPFKIDPVSKICVTSFQEEILLGKTLPPQPNGDGKRNLSSTTPAEASKNFSEPGFVLKGEDTKFVVNTLQMTSCTSGLTCCLPGYYGADSSSCTECPSNKPSSPFSAPNILCQCPNSGVNKCFACNNKCRPYDSQSKMCLPYQCPSGQTCKVQSGAATCV